MNVLNFIMVSGVLISAIALFLCFGASLMTLLDRIPKHRETGTWFARALCGSFAIVGLVSSAVWLFGLRYEADKNSIDLLYMTFQSALQKDRYQSAYSLMSPDYRKANSIAEFQARFSRSAADIRSLEPGRYLSVSGRTASLFPGSDHAPMSGLIYKFTKVGTQWYFTGETDLSLD